MRLTNASFLCCLFFLSFFFIGLNVETPFFHFIYLKSLRSRFKAIENKIWMDRFEPKKKKQKKNLMKRNVIKWNHTALIKKDARILCKKPLVFISRQSNSDNAFTVFVNTFFHSETISSNRFNSSSSSFGKRLSTYIRDVHDSFFLFRSFVCVWEILKKTIGIAREKSIWKWCEIYAIHKRWLSYVTKCDAAVKYRKVRESVFATIVFFSFFSMLWCHKMIEKFSAKNGSSKGLSVRSHQLQLALQIKRKINPIWKLQ